MDGVRNRRESLVSARSALLTTALIEQLLTSDASPMITLAVLGANGQVGAELCLMLAGRPDLKLIPVCRNRSGSAFLRWQGLACRHGRVADARDAKRLLADCDVIVNCSLASGTPAEIRRIEDRIVQNAFAYSKPGAKIIQFSTQSVYGDPRPLSKIRWRNPYGRAKLATERSVRHAHGAAKSRPIFLRLGHVCGTLQEISNTIRAQIRAGSVVLPSQDRSSNTVFTIAIVDAVDLIMGGNIEPGTYDLMNSPRWTWREVYEYEAAQCGISFSPLLKDGRPVPRLREPFIQSRNWRDTWRRLNGLETRPPSSLPTSLTLSMRARWHGGTPNARRTEIGALAVSPAMAEHLTWVENGRTFSLRPPRLRISCASQECAGRTTALPAWPADLPDARDEDGSAQ